LLWSKIQFPYLRERRDISTLADETHLFTEPAELDEDHEELPDGQNPDYLGKFVFERGSVKYFEGQVLSVAEQAYLAVFIEAYQEPDS
jgi:hypothetical protein